MAPGQRPLVDDRPHAAEGAAAAAAPAPTPRARPPSAPCVHARRAALFALSALSAHGVAVALAAALLRSLVVGGGVGAVGEAHPPHPLPRLRAALARAVERGVAENARLRARLRQQLARVVRREKGTRRDVVDVYDDDSDDNDDNNSKNNSPSTRPRHTAGAALERLAWVRAERCRLNGAALRAVVKAARSVLRDAHEEHAFEEVHPRVWVDLDRLLGDAVANAHLRTTAPGGALLEGKAAEAECPALVQAGADLVRSSQLRLSVTGLLADDCATDALATAVQDSRRGMRIRARLNVRRLDATQFVVEGTLANYGAPAVSVLGLHLVPPGDIIPICAHLPSFYDKQRTKDVPVSATVTHSTRICIEAVRAHRGRLFALWDFHLAKQL